MGVVEAAIGTPVNGVGNVAGPDVVTLDELGWVALAGSRTAIISSTLGGRGGQVHGLNLIELPAATSMATLIWRIISTMPSLVFGTLVELPASTERAALTSRAPAQTRATGVRDAGRPGGWDCDGTCCDQAPMRSLHARSAPLGAAPPGGRQINSKDTQAAESVVSKSQAA
ncbi:hypothetical protein ACN26Y_24775 [Micromonospora sp. WMMD558]|uniref:hypothetical protein n=1 Tax=Micromonospora sp. WMMD558 TaxID=3403462 RepID=UPI003BF48400